MAPDLPYDDPTATWDAYAEVMTDALSGAVDADPGPYPLEAPPRLRSVYIYTTEDEFFTPESRRWAARNVFGIEPIEMEGGHFPMLERPAELADVLVASLKDQPGAAA